MSGLRLYKLFNKNIKSVKVYYRRYLGKAERTLSSISSIHNETKLAPVGNYFQTKINDVVSWYEQVTGMDEVRLLQNRVIESQDKFMRSQEQRREASKNLVSIQAKLKDIYAELDTTSRGEERYLLLITQEHAILKEEKKLQAEFLIQEREERESFNLLSNFVKESHEKERAQAERTKYWSVIGSILGTIIGILGSSINNEFKMRELRNLVKETSLKQAASLGDPALLFKHEQELSSIMSDIKNIMHHFKESSDNSIHPNIIGRLDQLMHTVNQNIKNTNVDITPETVQELNHRILELKGMLNLAQGFDGQLVAIPADLETLIHSQRNETRLLLFGMAITSILIPTVVYCIQRLS